jgi:signal transduction histidine kinase
LATASPFDAALRDVLDGLHAATQELVRAADPADVAQRAADLVLRLTASTGAVVAVGTRGHGFERYFPSSGERPRPLTDAAVSEMLAAAGFGDTPRARQDRHRAAVIGAEIHTQGNAIGAIAVTRPHDYTDTERVALDIFATYVGLALTGARRWDEQTRSVRRVERAHEQAVEVLTSVSSHAAKGENLTDFYRRLARTVGELVGAERVLFWRLGPDHKLAPLRGGYRIDDQLLARLKPTPCEPDGDDLASRVVYHDLIFRANRTSDPPEYGYVLEILGVNSAISVPWRAGDERLGLVAAYDSTRPGGFSREDTWVLQKAGLAAGLVTLLWHTQDDLRKTVERLTKVDSARQMLLKNMTTVVEKERKRFVSELHDDALQKLTAAELAIARLAPNVPIDPQQHERVKTLLEQTESSLRRLVFEVRPPALEGPDGLAQSIRDRVAMLAGTGIDAEVDLQLAGDMSIDVRAMVFRQVAEAIGNVERHSQAKSVKVSASVVDGGVLGVVEDDGQGFVVAERTNLPGHLGLLALRERALMAGGRYKIESAPGQGTRIEFWIPLGQ